MSQRVPSSPGDEPQSALLLTDEEWSDLAEICKVFLVLPVSYGVMPKHSDLAERIIKASEA